jgi:hypothetical protein
VTLTFIIIPKKVGNAHVVSALMRLGYVSVIVMEIIGLLQQIGHINQNGGKK